MSPPAPSVVVAAGFLLIVFALVIVVPLLSGYDPYTQNLSVGLIAPLQSMAGSSHPLGTDFLGRDLLSRLALAGQISLLIGLFAVSISLAIGVLLGLLAGFFRGGTETVIMGLADLQLSIPRILLLIVVTAFAGAGAFNLALLLGLTSWVSYGRVARAMALSLREREFVLAATTHGASPAWNIRRHLLPNVIPQMLIIGSFELGQIITLEASLSYLGLGIQPPLPSWGLMISEGQRYLALDPWLSIFPGVALFLVVCGVQFVGRRLTASSDEEITLAAQLSG